MPISGLVRVKAARERAAGCPRRVPLPHFCSGRTADRPSPGPAHALAQGTGGSALRSWGRFPRRGLGLARQGRLPSGDPRAEGVARHVPRTRMRCPYPPRMLYPAPTIVSLSQIGALSRVAVTYRHSWPLTARASRPKNGSLPAWRSAMQNMDLLTSARPIFSPIPAGDPAWSRTVTFSARCSVVRRFG